MGTPSGRLPIYTNIDGAPRRISREVPQVSEFSPFWGKSLGGFGTPVRPILPFFKSRFRLGGMALLRSTLRREFPCVFGCKRYIFLETPRGRASIYTNIGGAPGSISRKVPKVPEFSPFLGESLGGFRHFDKDNFTSFYHVAA